MRTWTLRTGNAGQVLASPPSLGPGLTLEQQAEHPGVEVVELEPVLDLLEAWHAHMELLGIEVEPLNSHTQALLRAHGRLDD